MSINKPTRLELLTKISFTLARRGESPRNYGSRGELRGRYPGIPHAMKLEEIAAQVGTADLSKWRSPPQPRRKALISDEEIRRIAEEFGNVEAARRAGISRERVRVIRNG